MDPLTATAAAAVVSAGANYLGQKSANAASAKSVSKQMEFQKYMARTQYQRTAMDLKDAGFNRMLAVKGLSGSTPSGASYTAQNEMTGAGQLATSAAEAYRLKKEYKLADQAVKTQAAQEFKAQEDAKVSQTAAKKLKVEKEILDAQKGALESEANTRKIKADIDAKTAPYEKGIKMFGDVIGTAAGATAFGFGAKSIGKAIENISGGAKKSNWQRATDEAAKRRRAVKPKNNNNHWMKLD